MLYLVSLNGEIIPQSLPVIRENLAYPFQVECMNSNLDLVSRGSVIKIIGYKLGRYQTSDGKAILGTDPVWRLVG